MTDSHLQKKQKTSDVIDPLADVPSRGKEYYFLAVDIESCGKNDILAIGLVFGKRTGEVLEKHAFCAKPPLSQSGFDKETWNQFWKHHPDILARIDAASTEDPIKEFYEMVVRIDLKYGPFGRKHKDVAELRLVSDNPAYDIGLIDYHLIQRFGKKLNACFSDYVPTDDPTEQETFLLPEEKKIVSAWCTTEHDHFPSNDAEQIFQRRCGIAQVEKARKTLGLKATLLAELEELEKAREHPK
jgi:hypothetical protein